MKRAVIVGVFGQDGQLLYDLLLKDGYSIVGIGKGKVRSTEGSYLKKIDILKFQQVADLINKFNPSEVYYLAAFHHSSESLPLDNSELFQRSYEINVAGFLNFLESIRIFSPATKIFYASSSHIFEPVKRTVQDENTLINPSSSYGITKALGLELCRLYRSRHGIFAAAGILYNHESILRADSFISKKIINGVVEIKLDKRKMLVLGDLKAVIDWGYAPDYVRAMQLILKNKIPNDFIIATGRRHTVLDFVKAVFGYLKLDWKQHVVVDVRVVHKSRFYRIGNPAFLKKKTGWKPSVNFKEMVNLLLKQKLNISA